MLDVMDETLSAAATRWLAGFGDALGKGDAAGIQALFKADSHWRDLVTFTAEVSTTSGGAKIAAALIANSRGKSPTGFALDAARTAPRVVMRAGEDVVEAFFRFETARTRSLGIVRFAPPAASGDMPQAWTLFTAIDEIKGHEEHIGSRRPRGEAYSRDFTGPNWLDRRQATAAYTDRDPEVLVVGGGQAGLSTAARLNQLGMDTLVIDREARIGDNWRHRYHALTLHNQVQVNHLPYMPFPPNFPTYIPKDKLASWFESYAEAMEINFWTGTEFLGGSHDEATGRWTVQMRRDGEVRTLHPKHVVMATGASDMPKEVNIPSLANYKGRVIHASGYKSAEGFAGRHVTVIGTGTSGHDIAQDLVSNGASVTLVQRSPTLVVNVEPAAQIPYTLYSEGRPLEECDLIAVSAPMALVEKSHRLMAVQSREMDRELLADLRRAGFRINDTDERGWQFMFLTRGGGYYFNVGCSELIIAGKVPVVQFTDIESFTPDGWQMKDGRTQATDMVVLATGYHTQEVLVKKLFGEAIAARVGRVWGIDWDKQELNSMFTRTGQRGLWFIAGSFAQCRIYSKYLALQIKAAEAGLAGTA